MVVQIKSGKWENGKSFSFNLYRKRSTPVGEGGTYMSDGSPANLIVGSGLRIEDLGLRVQG